MNRRSLLLASCLLLLASSLTAGPKLYSIEVRNAPLKDIVRMLAKMDGKNVVIPDNIEGLATASFEATTLEEALRSILEVNNLGLIVKDNVFQVATQETLEKLGEDLVTTTFGLKYAKATAVGNQVKSLLSARGQVMVDERVNAITVRDTRFYLQDVQTLIANIDKVDRQVLIEAKVLEAKVDFIRSLGIQWGASKTTGNVRVSGLTTVGTAQSGRPLGLNTPASGLGGGNPLAGLALAFGGTLSDVQLSAAEQKGDVNILSRPSIVAMNNQMATIKSGITFFVKTSGDITIGAGTTTTTSSRGSNLQQIQAGITLKVTPQITEDDKINLFVEVTESQPDFSRVVDGIPTILDNNATTTVLLNDGEATVIGGLFQTQGTKTKRGIPGFQRLPLFGALFRSTTKGSAKNELLIFIKPTIVKEGLAQLPHYYEEDSLIRSSHEEERRQQEIKAKLLEKRRKSKRW